MKLRHVLLLIALILPGSLVLADEAVVYTVDNQAYEGGWYTLSPDAPMVLLVHDWDGLTGYEVQRARMLNKLGYNVFAVDLFGQGIRPEKIADRRQHTGALYQDREKLRRLMAAGLAAAGRQGGNLDNVVVMGYCFGGAAVLEAARAGMKARGFVTFHGGLQTPAGQDYSNVTSPLMILHGSADQAVTMADFSQLVLALEQSQVPHEMITFGGAPHAFTVFGAASYREDADMKSWAHFQRFLHNVTAL